MKKNNFLTAVLIFVAATLNAQMFANLDFFDSNTSDSFDISHFEQESNDADGQVEFATEAENEEMKASQAREYRINNFLQIGEVQLNKTMEELESEFGTFITIDLDTEFTVESILNGRIRIDDMKYGLFFVLEERRVFTPVLKSIVISDRDFKLANGIGMGATMADLKKAYENHLISSHKEQDNTFTQFKIENEEVGTRKVFHLINNKVYKIEINSISI